MKPNTNGHRLARTTGCVLLAMTLAMTLALPAQAQFSRKSPMTGMDANGDGQVTLQELESARAVLFAGADLNRDGLLDRGEFMSIRQGRTSSRSGKRGVEKFEHADENHDGHITQSEFRSGARRMMNALDRNGDFRLDERDFSRRKRR